MIYWKQSCITDTEYDPSGNSSLPFHVGANIKFSTFYDFFIFFYV